MRLAVVAMFDYHSVSREIPVVVMTSPEVAWWAWGDVMAADHGCIAGADHGLIVGAHGAVAVNRITTTIVADEVALGIDRCAAGLVTTELDALVIVVARIRGSGGSQQSDEGCGDEGNDGFHRFVFRLTPNSTEGIKIYSRG